MPSTSLLPTRSSGLQSTFKVEILGNLLFYLKLTGLFVFPALVYCASLARSGDLTFSYLAEWLVGNFMYMAAPHYLAISAFFIAPLRQQTVLITLVILNVLLVSFQGWIWFLVPPFESGLAWAYYLPAWVLCLGAIAGMFEWRERRSRA